MMQLCMNYCRKKWKVRTMGEKTCIKCSLKGDEALFVKKTNLCKACRKEYRKEHSDAEKESQRKYREKYPEKRKESQRKWRENNPESKTGRCKKWRETYPTKVREYAKKYYKENVEKERTRNKKYFKTPTGKTINHRNKAKRRNLGHEPLNTWFKGSEAHHLRYSKTIEEQDNNITLYVPRKLHRSIHHNGNTGQGMKEINIACLQWYFENTPKEEQDPKASKLYNNYLTLPEPEWR